jgi:hypothetical protein
MLKLEVKIIFLSTLDVYTSKKEESYNLFQFSSLIFMDSASKVYKHATGTYQKCFHS